MSSRDRGEEKKMKTLVNFRDAGGMKTESGQRVVTGKIFRSGEIVKLSAEDRQSFTDEYGIKTIFDFRSETEITERPDDRFKGVHYENIDIMKNVVGPTASLADMQNAVAAADEHMRTLYTEMVTSPSCREGFSRFLKMVAATDEPFIFHCFAGKDRTGMGAALILEILGVSQADIYTDYLITNEQRQTANEKMFAEMKDAGASEEQIAAIGVMMTVKAEYLDVVYELMSKKYGSPLQFIKEGLALSDSELATIRSKYLIKK